MSGKSKKSGHREPLFHVSKRSIMPFWQSFLIRAGAVVAALLFCAVVVYFLADVNPLDYYKSMWKGSFGTERRFWSNLLHPMALLLCVGLAVTPAFRMRFWNIGAEGQVLAGGLATAAVMFYFSGQLPRPVLYLAMIGASILAGIIWAVIPAVFKAKWNTNETLFTLMMNYVALYLVKYVINIWVPNGSGKMTPMYDYMLPQLGFNKMSEKYFLNILVVLLLTVLLYIYMRFSKHGYEISVVGESEKTAKYIGINVKKVIVRTMVVSGALCGIAGLLLVGGTNGNVSENTAGGRGFTAIMVSWLAKFNPFTMIFTSFLIVFLQAGSKQVNTDFGVKNAISDIVTAIIIFFIIGCEFFINYKIMLNRHSKEVA